MNYFVHVTDKAGQKWVTDNGIAFGKSGKL